MLPTLITLAILAVSIVLIFGLFTMVRGTNPNLSQKLMRLRVALQFIAIFLVMLGLYLYGQ